MIMIDIIIPAYNAHDSIDKCLSSILIQKSTNYTVTIVNDGGDDYQSIINKYNSQMPIREITYQDKINRGPGYARQFGIHHTQGECILFMDADDMLYSPYSLQSLYSGLNLNPNYVVCAGRFVEDISNDNNNVLLHQEEMTWVFGKLYRRKFIDKYNIRFCPGSKWNEDYGFNSCIRLCTSEQAQINFITDIVYCWSNKPGSITNNPNYPYGNSFVGSIENTLWAIDFAKKNGVNQDAINQFAIVNLFDSYQYLMEAYENDRRFMRQIWAWLYIFYDIAIKPIRSELTEELICAFQESMDNSDNPLYISFYEFLDKLEAHEAIEYDDSDISGYFPEDSCWLILK